MVVGMLVVGIGLVLAGLLAVGFGIPVKEFSFGNTLILTGVMAGCSRAIMLALAMAVREPETLARRLWPGVPEPPAGITAPPLLPPSAFREAAAMGRGVV